MGKTKRILNKARKEYFKELEKKINNSDNEEVYEEPEIEEESYETKLDRVSYYVRRLIFDYVKEEALPMCEYLNMENVSNYINWVIKKS